MTTPSTNTTMTSQIPNNLATIKARQKTTWTAGDFGRVARFTEPLAEEFMTHVPLVPGLRVLDLACGTGNLAILAARAGCAVTGLDLAPNLLEQARQRAQAEGLTIEFDEGDVEQLPYADASFDVVISMFGVMFAPIPERAAGELLRVCRPGGHIALANWTPNGFIGRMFATTRAFVPPPPGLAPPLLWGDEVTARRRLEHGVSRLEFVRCLSRFAFPFDVPATVEFFRQYYGPTNQAFAALDDSRQALLRRALEELFEQHNLAGGESTEVAVQYLRIAATRMAQPGSASDGRPATRSLQPTEAINA